MNKISALLLTITLFSIPLFAQHLLYLKNGEKLNGKLIEYKKGKLIFVFQNNSMSFNENDVASITLDEKYSIKNSSTQNSELKGTVVYYRNMNYGDLPDASSKVFILNSIEMSDIDTTAIMLFVRARMIRELIKLGDTNPKNYDELRKIGIESDEEFKAVDKIVNDAVEAIKKHPKAIQLTADASGSFSKKLSPGIYGVLVVSNKNIGISLTECMGKIHFENINIPPAEEIITNVKF